MGAQTAQLNDMGRSLYKILLGISAFVKKTSSKFFRDSLYFFHENMQNEAIFMQKRQYCVIGHPIGHTMSPFINSRLFALRGVQADYTVMDIPPQELSQKTATLRTLQGFNITIPHKQAILPYLDEMDSNARAFGSVNTVCVGEDGRLTGHTTDGPGCLAALRGRGIQPGGSMLLLGAGGAARAVAFALCEQVESPRLTIACRKKSLLKAEALCRDLQNHLHTLGKTGELSSAVLEELDGRESFSLLLNCTSVGMYPHAGVSPVPETVIRQCGAVFDAVYNPDTTELLRLAEKNHIPTVHGMDMLVWQAAVAHGHWFGHTFTQSEMDAVIRDAVGEMKRRFPEKEGQNE